MSFDVSAQAYQRFMGRFSDPLGADFLRLLAPQPGQRAIDIGAGAGALTAPLVGMLGADAVAAIEPSPSFVQALGERLPGVDVREASAEVIPFPDNTFDLALAQLVVHFMPNPVEGLTEMARVTVPGGTVAASVWDFAAGRAPMSPFWRAAKTLSPDVDDETTWAGAASGHLATLFEQAGLTNVHGGELTVVIAYPGFDDWWEPLTLGVGPAGAHLAALDVEQREELKERCAQLLPTDARTIAATAWTAVGTVAA